MGYSFLRINKIKTSSALTSAYQHNYRKMEVINADPEKQKLNDEFISLKGKTYLESFNEKIQSLEYYNNHKVRKNAVIVLEILSSFSKEDIGTIDIEAWKKDTAEWLRASFNTDINTYGDNVVSMMVHNDEAGNVHCHTIVIPINPEGKLGANYYIDGREKLFGLQNSYGKIMEINHCLKRGQTKSITNATHEDIKHFYATISNEFYVKNVCPQPTSTDTIKIYQKKVEYFIKDLKGQHLRELKEKDSFASKIQSNTERKERESSEMLKETVYTVKKENKKLKKEMEGLVHEFGSIATISKKQKEYEDVKIGLETMPDDFTKQQFLRELSKVSKNGIENKNKKKQKKKEILLNSDSKTIFT